MKILEIPPTKFPTFHLLYEAYFKWPVKNGRTQKHCYAEHPEGHSVLKLPKWHQKVFTSTIWFVPISPSANLPSAISPSANSTIVLVILIKLKIFTDPTLCDKFPKIKPCYLKMISSKSLFLTKIKQFGTYMGTGPRLGRVNCRRKRVAGGSKCVVYWNLFAKNGGFYIEI